jgi:pyruvate/2-oxoacid:ferredoxin oxidoreductase beta subunit/Pyruvate/2-oxoacid:ferredoxin oxidoreductase gamma subunit
MPYCKGCGHHHVVRALARALEDTGLDAEHLCLVSDIGCVGLIDRLFPGLHTVHTTHGRSPAFATGLRVADGLLYDGALKTVVVLGDGGATIGLLHLVAAAQLNVDITAVIHNNHLYGMTGGQASGMTPESWFTATTPGGNPLPPLDMMGVLRSAGATFLARELATSKGLAARLLEAIDHPGFAVVEVVELCTAFGIRFNEITGKKLVELAERTGEPLGLRERRADRMTFGQAWRERARSDAPGSEPPDEAGTSAPRAPSPSRPSASEPTSVGAGGALGLGGPVGLWVAGTAGEGVQSSAAMCAEIAVELGLYATHKRDNLVTQGSGYSISELLISPRPIHYTGIDRAQAVIAVSAEGLTRLRAMGAFERLAPEAWVLLDEGLSLPEEVDANLLRLPLRARAGGRNAALAAVAWVVARLGLFEPQRLAERSLALRGPRAQRSVKAVSWVLEQSLH